MPLFRTAAVICAAWFLPACVGFAHADVPVDPAQREITPEIIRMLGTDRNGNYVAGDMVFTEQSLRVAEKNVVAPYGYAAGSAWTGGNVYYAFDAAIDTSHRAMFREAADWWSQVSGVRFFESSTAGNRIQVVIPSGGVYCNSVVGMSGGTQTLNLGDSATSTCWTRGIIAHEIGHALGLLHEQNRSDRATFVSITTTGGGSSACNALITTNWGIQSGSGLTNYDFGSIMHYPSFGALSSQDCPAGVTGTITALAAQPAGLPAGSETACLSASECTGIMGNRAALSLRDAWAMAQRYGYRFEASVKGNGTGTFGVSGASSSCGSQCYLGRPGMQITVSATPAADSMAHIAGPCSGVQSCSFQPVANSPLQVTFIRKKSMAGILAAFRRPDIIYASGFDAP